ncbi:MAG: hypothetical protein AAF581_05355 [Planctomycetota bacterium]
MATPIAYRRRHLLCRLGVLAFAMLLGALSTDVRAQAPSSRAPQATKKKPTPQPTLVRSTMQLLGMKFEATHERPSGTPLPPDLSRPKELLIPRVARFRVALPVLWGEQVLAPGEYRLGIVVDDDLQPFLRLQPVRGGSPRRLALTLGHYNEPGDGGIVISLSAVHGDKEEIGSLQVRWGAVLFQGDFRPVHRRTSEAGGYRLSSFDFPRLAILPRELALGELRRSSGGNPLQLTLLLGGATPRLRLDDKQYLTLLDDRREMQQELSRRQRAGAEKAELRRLEARLAGVEARLKSLDPQATTRELPGKKAPAAPDAPPGFDIRLEEVDDRSFVSIVVVGVRYRFGLD